MRAVVLRELGGPEQLRLEELPAPVPGPGFVLVRVRAAGVCGRDLLDRKGAYPFMKRPVVPGHELAGEVTAVGEGVSGVRPGARVTAAHRAPCGTCVACRRGEETRCASSPFALGLTFDGAYAELVAVDAAALVPIPDEVSFEEACFVHCTAGVALRALRDHGGVGLGSAVLVTGASGGVGIHAVQLARLLGARVVAATTSQTKAAALREAGADAVIVTDDHRRLAAEARAFSPGGVDVALEVTGIPTLQGSLRALRPGGRLVLVGNITAERAEINPGYLILNEISVHGSSSATRADLALLLDLVRARRLRPVVADVLPLVEARAAQERLARKEVIGRLVLRP